MNKLIIHDDDLQRWALQKANELNLPNFKASRKWLDKFKKSQRIVSRKITKFVSSDYVEKQEEIENMALSFVHEAKEMFVDYDPNEVCNTDQSGFNKELHSGRSLEIADTKQIQKRVQSVSATTHSYTIQPTITAGGKLLSPLYLVLQEKNGTFGPKVEQHLKTFTPTNIKLEASKSGKVGKRHVTKWFVEVYSKNVPEKSLLLLDALPTHKDINLNASTNNELSVIIDTSKTTGLVQPLDAFFFRTWKNFVRKISYKILLDGLDIKLLQRDNIISCAHAVLCSEI